MSALDTSQVAPAVTPPVMGSVKSTGAQLVAAFPPQPVAASWPATQARRSAVVDRVLAAPFALDNPTSQRKRRLGVLAVLGWLGAQPGHSWQQRWQASGAEDHPDWRLLVGTDRGKPLPHVTSGLLVLICADVIRPRLDWLLRFAPARHNLAVEMARTRDRDVFAELTALCQGRVGLQSQQQALTNIAIIMAVKGGNAASVRVGDCLELLATAARTRVTNDRHAHSPLFYQRCARTATSARMRPPRSKCSSAVGNPAASSSSTATASPAARCAMCWLTTCANASRRWTSPPCSTWPTCSASCFGPIWRRTTPASTHCSCPAMSPRRGSSAC
ncbi:MAG: hypothetical protein ACLP9Y_20095 [Mycobacterium sp.]